MSLRVGFDLDGVIADFRSAFAAAAIEAGVTMARPDAEAAMADPLSSRDVRRIWDYVRRAPNWWISLAPYEPDQIVRIYELSRRLRWEVVFMTRRPETAGEPVQLQTQWWLEQHGFHYPAAVTVPGSRGELANALRLDVIVDDQIHNCADVIGASTAKALLVVRDAVDPGVQEHAISRGIGVVFSLAEAVDVIEHLQDVRRERRGRLQRLTDWFSGDRPQERAMLSTPDPDRVRLQDE